MKKNFTLLFTFLGLLNMTNSYGQVTVSVNPTTPLNQFVFEISSPKIMAYTKEEAQFGEGSSFFTINAKSLSKYSDLPLYSSFSEVSELVAHQETRSTISRTTNYVAYTLEVKNDETDNLFEVYAKDTFFLSGTKISSITEVLYDDSKEGNRLTYDVVYGANNLITKIMVKDATKDNLSFFDFVGLDLNYNNNLTVESSKSYTYGFVEGESELSIVTDEYEVYYYSKTDPTKVDSSYYSTFDLNEFPEHHYFVLNKQNEITAINVFVYDDEAEEYSQFGRHLFTSTSTGILSSVNRAEMQIFPNPVSNVAYVKEVKSGNNYTIVDFMGKTIASGVYDDLSGVEVAGLPSGTYVLQISNGQRSWTGKFIK